LQQLQSVQPAIDYTLLAQMLQKRENPYQKRLLVRYGQHLKAIDTDEIAYIFVESRAVMLQTFDQQHLPLDYQLDALEEVLDPAKFFRINRKIITSFRAIKRMHSYSRSRIQLELEPSTKIDAVVSTERTPAFKKWLEGHI
jgi:two-component system LytT family response regulator